MKPFAVYLVKNSATRHQLEQGSYGHLLLTPAATQPNVQHKLTQFPNIVAKASDLNAKSAKAKKKFQILLTRSCQVKQAQLDAMNV